MSPEPPPEPEPEPSSDDLDFYYGLNRRTAQKQDAPFTRFGMGGVFFGVACVVGMFALTFITGNWILGILLLAFSPLLFLLGAAFGNFLLDTVYQLFTNISGGKK